MPEAAATVVIVTNDRNGDALGAVGSAISRGVVKGFRDALRDRGGRRPVRRSTWRLYRRLAKRPIRVEELA